MIFFNHMKARLSEPLVIVWTNHSRQAKQPPTKFSRSEYFVIGTVYSLERELVFFRQQNNYQTPRIGTTSFDWICWSSLRDLDEASLPRNQALLLILVFTFFICWISHGLKKRQNFPLGVDVQKLNTSRSSVRQELGKNFEARIDRKPKKRSRPRPQRRGPCFSRHSIRIPAFSSPAVNAKRTNETALRHNDKNSIQIHPMLSRYRC